MALAVAFAPLLLEPYGWRSLWFATALVSIGFGLLFLFYIYPMGEAKAVSRGKHWVNVKITVKSLGPWLLALAFMSYTFQWMTIMVWLPTFAIEELGLTIGTTAILTALAIAVNIPGNWLGSYLVHLELDRWKMIAIGTSIMGICALLIFSDYFSGIYRFALVLIFSFFGGIQPAALISGPTVHSPSPSQFGTTSGLMYQGSQSGQFLGPPFVALIVTISGSCRLFIILAYNN